MPTQLTLRDVRKSFGDRLLLDNISFAVRPGERVGVVGENGAGKSTLLRLIAGRDRPDDGEITVAANSVGYLGQTPELSPERTVAAAVDVALADLRAMERRLRTLESTLDQLAALHEYGDLLTAFELRDGYQADARVDKAMHALGLAHVDRDRQLGTLSGGEQARLGLACLLAAAPEVMLLDEPTNHLDAGALAWLEDHLRAHRGTVVAVSHDRVFLERVATTILEVDGDRRTVTRYGDGYTGYLTEKAAARRRWEQSYERWRTEIAHLTDFAATTAHRVAPGRAMKDNNKLAYDRDKGRVQSSVSSRVRNAQERLRRLREDPIPRPPDPLRFTGRLTTATAPPADAPAEFCVDDAVTDVRTAAAVSRPSAAGAPVADVAGPGAATSDSATRDSAGTGAVRTGGLDAPAPGAATTAAANSAMAGPADAETAGAASASAGSAAAGTTAHGTHADGATAEAATANRAPADGATTPAAVSAAAGVTAPGATADGAGVDGATAEVVTADGTTVNGATTPAAGSAAAGITGPGAHADGVRADGTTAEAATADGATTPTAAAPANGTSANGTIADGATTPAAAAPANGATTAAAAPANGTTAHGATANGATAAAPANGATTAAAATANGATANGTIADGATTPRAAEAADTGETAPQPIVELRDVCVGERLWVDELTVGGRERLLVHGPNGAGKTTLLRVLAGALTPDTGIVRRRGRIGYLAQEIPTHQPKRALLAAFAQGRVGTVEENAERLLSLGLFRPADLLVPEGALSAGQRRRLSLARLLTEPVDLLLLDEPSNHLSLTLVEELEEAIDAFTGALVVVSHDRALRRRFTGAQLELVDGRLGSRHM